MTGRVIGGARRDPRTRTGFGRVLVFVYGIFAVAATARALVQLATQYDMAPAAYWLSLFSGIVYILATVAMGTGRRTVALVAVGIELLGVLVVGTLSQPADVDRASVWSHYGSGYVFVPLILPFVALWWLLRGSGRQPARDDEAAV